MRTALERTIDELFYLRWRARKAGRPGRVVVAGRQFVIEDGPDQRATRKGALRAVKSAASTEMRHDGDDRGNP